MNSNNSGAKILHAILNTVLAFQDTFDTVIEICPAIPDLFRVIAKLQSMREQFSLTGSGVGASQMLARISTRFIPPRDDEIPRVFQGPIANIQGPRTQTFHVLFSQLLEATDLLGVWDEGYGSNTMCVLV